ncbi:MAG: T9SS C-terminal target domain-containing protein [Bacteroidetes bacterium]|nr:MAG: T9SS C-terminal target domain-containing protein [Bacteroidota bacterium]
MRILLLFSLLFSGGSMLLAQPQPFTRIFGEPLRFEQGAAVAQTSDGKIFFTGTSAADSMGSFDVWLSRFDETGQEKWARAYGSLLADYPQGMWLVGDSLLLIAGNRYDFDIPRQEAFILALDTAGQVLWYRTYGDSTGNASFKNVRPLPGGDLAAIGYISDPAGGGNDTYVVRLDAQGNPRWQSPLRDSLIDVGHALLPGPDGSLLVVGDRQQPAGHYNAYAARLDSLGAVEWVLPFTSPLNGGAQSLLALRDSTYLMIGESAPDTTTTAFDYYLVNFTADGEERWRRYLGGPGGDAAFAGFQDSDGDLYLAGYGYDSLSQQTDVLVWRCDSSGLPRNQRFYGGPGIDHGYGMWRARDGGFLVAGFSAEGIENQFLLVYDTLAAQTTALNPRVEPVQLWPQPVARTGRIFWSGISGPVALRLFDSQGRLIAQRSPHPSTSWDLPPYLPSGHYWLQLSGGGTRYGQLIRVE